MVLKLVAFHTSFQAKITCCWQLQRLLREHTLRAGCHSRASCGNEAVEAVEQGAAEAAGVGACKGVGAGSRGRLPMQGPTEATSAGSRKGRWRLMEQELAE